MGIYTVNRITPWFLLKMEEAITSHQGPSLVQGQVHNFAVHVDVTTFYGSARFVPIVLYNV